MSPNTASAAIAQAYAEVPVATTETRMVPAIAVPNDEPRLEMLRDSPEISPCSSSGKLDWTTFTEGVSIAPTPRPMSARPGNECPDAVGAPDEDEQEHDPGDGDDEAGDDQRLLREPLGESLGCEGRGEDAERRRGEDDARLDRAVAANLLQVDGDDERRPQEHQPLDVLRDEREVARPVLEQPGGEQRLLPGPLAGADEEEERQQEERADHEEDRHEGVVAAGLKDPEDDAEHADRRQDRPDRVERAGRIGLERIFEPAAQQDDHGDDERPGRRTRRAS